MTRGAPLLSAVVVSFNSAEMISKTITHLEKVLAALDFEVLVVDNASSDGTAEAARRALRRGRVIRSPNNLGFGCGVNLGLSAARGEFVLIMNDDVLPSDECVAELLEVVSDASVGLAGPRMLNSDGSPSFSIRRYLPGLRDEIARVGDAIRKRNTRSSYPLNNADVDVELLVCACVVGRTQTLRALGGFNSVFFMYGEDLDLCKRLLSAGYRLRTVPSAVAVHARETSPERRIRGRDFSRRILDARDTYYRIWLSRAERIAINLWRAIGPTDQPFRLKYHLAKATWDGPSLSHLRAPTPLPFQEP